MTSSKILIVDDALFHRALCKEILEGERFEISEASTGEQALVKIQQETPDLVLLDVTLPGKDGFETLEEIKKISPELKVIMVTAQGQTNFLNLATRLGACDYVVKPFKPEKLLSAIQKALIPKGGRI